MATTHLVTGCAGFLGSNLVERLLRAGHRVIGFDNLSMGSLANLQDVMDDSRFRFVQRDVTEPDAFVDVNEEIGAIVHLAAYKIPRYGQAVETLKINYQAALVALDLARRLSSKFVLASTSDVYGRNPDVPFSEARSDSVIGNSKSPRWSYAISKLFDEHLALAYQDAYGFPATILRFFGSYGPKQHLSWWGGPQAVFIDCALQGIPMPIHGDGLQTRSFTYVTDTIEGIYQAMVRPEANGEIINIGSTHEITILELARLINQLAGADEATGIQLVPYESFSSKKYEDVRRRVPDDSLSKRLLGVTAKVGIEDGLRRTIEWQRAVRAAERLALVADR